jgi:hypothetical protein
MGDITTADFERVPDTIPLGENAARGMADRLATLAVPVTCPPISVPAEG